MISLAPETAEAVNAGGEYMEAIDPAALGIGKLFSTIRDALIVGDPQTGRIILWNDAAESLFGYSAEEAIGCQMEMLVPDHLKEMHREGLRRFAETGHGRLVDSGDAAELPAIHKNGSEIFVELTLTPIKGEKIPGYFAGALIRDVTEKRRYADELQRANEELHAVNQAMKDFVTVASHDLRSPITAILGFAVMLNKTWDRSGDKEKRQYLEIVERQARQLSRLVDDLLTMSEVEAGAIDTSMVDTPVEDVVARGIEFYSHLTELETSIAPELSVRADPDHLQRIIANFVGNALRYGKPPIEISAAAVNGSVEILVRDHGEGVPDDFLPRLFEKFARADTEATRLEKGSGLGLSIVRGLAEANGGEVWYEKAEPQGACFGVRLESAAATTAAGDTVTEDQIKVLAVVEDDPDVRTLVRVNLAEDPRLQILGEVASAEEAIELARHAGRGLGLIILDHSLAGPLSGFEAAPILKELAPSAKIILFTAHDQLRVKAKEDPSIDAFLLKTRSDELLPLAERLMGLSQL